MDPSGSATFAELAAQPAEIGRHCYARGWALGTSGNFSAVVRRNPMRLAITASGVDKGVLSVGQVVEIDQDGKVVGGSGAPSAEASLHLTIARARRAGAVLHTHSIWGTILSDAATDNGLAIEGYEMRSEEHTSELQSHHDLVCRLLLEKKKQKTNTNNKQKKKKNKQLTIAKTKKKTRMNTSNISYKLQTRHNTTSCHYMYHYNKRDIQD